MYFPAIRPQYDEHGTTEYYRQFGATYRNPHEPVIHSLIHRAAREWSPDFAGMRVLDLACGSGEVTLALQQLGCADIDGVDPYTGEAYFERTGRGAEPISFAEIAQGVLQDHLYDLCVCSFALHLVEPSLLPNLCLQLSLICGKLIVLTPHKRPYIKSEWGWRMREEIMQSRVRLRAYDSVSL